MDDRALWLAEPGRVELRTASLPPLPPHMVQVRALVSGISRGTEHTVWSGRVPESEWQRMRCPFQEGEFPGPVKYGYAMVGVVEAGPPALLGRRVFCLHPHQTRFQVRAEAVVPVPDDVPSDRAALAPQLETALNAMWDAGAVEGRVAVVGGGVIGLLTAWLAARTAEVTLIDTNPGRAPVADALGLDFALPKQAPAECELVFHASGTGEGLNLALELCRFEACVVELSWYGEAPVAARLGGAFHSQRLTLKSSQVGTVAPSRRGVVSHAQRLTEALRLCADPRLDILVSESTPLEEIPEQFGIILENPGTLCHLIRYPE
jgi:NADPH:quinone reductase-like Zn-dependent oxidoreductase